MPEEGPGDPHHGRPRSAAELQEQIRHTRQEIRDQVRSTRLEFDQANARITARVGRNLVMAIGIGVVFGALVVASLIVVKVVFVGVAMILVGFGTAELAGALRHAGIRVPVVGSAVAGVLAMPVTYVAMTPVPLCELDCTADLWFSHRAVINPQYAAGWLLAVIGAVVVAVVWRLVQRGIGQRGSGPLTRDLGATVLVQLYVTLLGSCTVALVAQPDGQWWVLGFLITVVATDLFAYVSGLLFGKHPMAPRISPKKTWEGFAGSVIMATVAGVLVAALMLREPIWFGFVFGPVIAVVGTLGDLGESMIKRDIGVKDMSSRLPGHGGFLDRIDSVLPAGAAALLLLFAIR